jgi:hypothetical protein
VSLRRDLLVALVALSGLFAATDASALPAPGTLPAIDFWVSGGDGWRADNDFRINWDPAVVERVLAATFVGYRVRNAAGNVVIGDTRMPVEAEHVEHIHVPAGPGQYSIELWLEDRYALTGPQTTGTLRFDDARPGLAQPQVPAGWISGDTSVTLRIAHPAGALPTSGIRGYAVSVSDDPAASPCAGPDRCSDAETDLRAGVGGDTLSLGVLSEGTHVIRSVAVSGAGMRSPNMGSAILRVDATPPEVAIGGAPQGWSSRPVRVNASATDTLSGMVAGGPNGPLTAIAVDGGVPTTIDGDAAAKIVTGEGAHWIASYARDAAGNIGCGLASLVRIDESGPRVAFAKTQDAAEPERIEATVADPLSGPDPTRGSIAVRPALSRQRFEPLDTTMAEGRLIAHWDSDSFPAGSYEFRATGYDLAGNSSDAVARVNGTRMVLPNPLKTPTTVQLGFGGKRLVRHRCSSAGERRSCHREAIEQPGSRPAARSVPYGRGVPISGRVIASSGHPRGGLPVQLVETFRPGATGTRRTTTVLTAADGTFSAHLEPGPGRDIEAVFAGDRTLAKAAARPLHLTVLASVHLRASSAIATIGGAPVVFSGLLANQGATIPSTGNPVELQFRLPHGAWKEFRSVQTDAGGRFHYAYAFSDDDSRGIRFQFRAYAPAQDGWPYEPAASRPVFVTGR